MKQQYFILMLFLCISLCSCSLKNEETSQRNSNSYDQIVNLEIDCPEYIEESGYTLKIKDIYVKCRNSEYESYAYDGNFVYITAEITNIASKKQPSLSVYVDMYDSNDRYVGKIIALSAYSLDSAEIGTILNDDELLGTDNVAKIVYASHH